MSVRHPTTNHGNQRPGRRASNSTVHILRSTDTRAALSVHCSGRTPVASSVWACRAGVESRGGLEWALGPRPRLRKSEYGEDGTRNPNTANAATASAFGFADWGCRAAPAQRSAAVPSVWGRPAPPAGAGPRWRRARLVRRHVSGGFSRRFRYTVQRLSSQASVRNRNALVPAYREAHQAQVAGPLWPEDATKIKQATYEMPVRRTALARCRAMYGTG